MIDITLQNFQSDLIAASQTTPVLLDIWAPWCGPCKQLGPVLERLEAAYAGRFILAKLNSDEQPQISTQLSQMFGVRSIPFCVMFVGGQPIDGFVGALPEAQIRTFLDKHVPTEAALAAETKLEDAEAALSQGDTSQAEAKLRAALDTDPHNDTARFDLIKLLLQAQRLAEAQTVFAPLADQTSGPIVNQRAVAFGHYLNAAHASHTARSLEALQTAIAANKRDFEAHFELAQHHFAAGRFTDAMEALLDILMRDKTWKDDLARRTYVAILEIMTQPAPKQTTQEKTKGALELTGKTAIAPNDPVIDQYRRKLSMVLF
jgi:putative thioredoxin